MNYGGLSISQVYQVSQQIFIDQYSLAFATSFTLREKKSTNLKPCQTQIQQTVSKYIIDQNFN
jgi:hypothetical protein